MASAKSLIIVESPAKASTIEKFLGKRHYHVVASMGHVRDLPKSQFGIDIEDDFAIKYINIRGKGKLINDLKKEAKKAKRVFLASDPDREGEAIAWHLAHVLNMDENEPCRITFNEITETAVKEAVAQPRSIDQNLVDAQQARRALDRLVGYQLSPLLWRKVKKGLSAGRVQSVALRLICEREKEINDFEPEEYWTLEAVFETPRKEQFVAQLSSIDGKKAEIHDKDTMQAVEKDLLQASYRAKEVKVSQKRKKAPLPFTTSTLQQTAASMLGFTARKTMRIAQSLYEGIDIGTGGAVGLITYMRTDSTRLSDGAKLEAQQFIEETFGSNYVSDEGKKRSKKNQGKVQDAHEAIRPTSVSYTPEVVKPFVDASTFKLYKLIWSRFVASQMADAVYEQTRVKIQGGRYILNASGSKLLFLGWREVYTTKEDVEDKMLPLINEGEDMRYIRHETKQHFTQPPARYNEASLVKTMEEAGIGRPSTYVSIIETIVARGYVVREQKQFCPTEIGVLVNDLLVGYFGDVINVTFTANLETELDQIEGGETPWKEVLHRFYDVFEPELKAADKAIGEVKIEAEITDELCPECGKPLAIKMGRYGKFLACTGFPDCRYTKPLLEKVGVPCPVCGKGEIVVRRSKKGRVFYGCSLYPECDFVSWDKPTGERCPTCSTGFLIEKQSKGTTRILCSEKGCTYKKEKEE